MYDGLIANDDGVAAVRQACTMRSPASMLTSTGSTSFSRPVAFAHVYSLE